MEANLTEKKVDLCQVTFRVKFELKKILTFKNFNLHMKHVVAF